ncbi:unnamed protein product, partial [Durusdinium trenchii]
ELTFLEFFAGEGNVWKAVRADSKNAVGIDWNYFDNPDGQNPMDILSNVYRIKWWMGHYGAPSAKPQVGWCNNQKFGHLDK